MAAVKEWLDDTKLSGHVIRDHPQHGAVIPAGMWGFRYIVSYNTMLYIKKGKKSILPPKN